MLKLNGPESKPLSGGAPKQLVIILHGYGSNGENMIDLADSFAQALPDAHFIAPNAHTDHEYGSGGYQWFSLMSRDEEFMFEGIKQASVILNNYIDEQLSRFNLTADKLILIGFSQGAMLSMHIAPRREEKIAAVVAYSGALLGGRFLSQEIKTKPEMLLVHGDYDDVVSPASLDSALDILKQNQIPAKGLMCKGLAHSINMEGIREASGFMKRII
jgi:phospholipase/carboxylesterase